MRRITFCSVCDGAGSVGCPECYGSGVIVGVGTCHVCYGEGEINCSNCGGSGEAAEEDDDY